MWTSVTCKEGQSYDYQTKQCITLCEEEEIFNKQTSSCESPRDCQNGQVWDEESKQCQAYAPENNNQEGGNNDNQGEDQGGNQDDSYDPSNGNDNRGDSPLNW